MVESERIRLNELPYFNPESALRHLSNYTMRRPVAEDLLNFLTKNKYNVELSDTQALVKMYDSDQDGALHNYELRRLLLSLTDNSFKDRFTRMPMAQPVGDMHTLGYGAE
jgi:Ca2+-binding EF-hand superfamily protein